jgi:hypothetical protein
MVVFCPGCGAKISAWPGPDNPDVQCPRCHSSFSTAGLKPAADAPPPRRFRKKTSGGSQLAGALILLAVLTMLGVGTAAVLYVTGAFGRGSSGSAGAPVPSGLKSAPAPVWQEYVNPEGKFRILFPGTPTREVFSRPGRSKAAKVKITSFTAETPDVTYSVAYDDFDPPRTDAPEQFLQRQHDELTAGRGGKLVSAKDVAAGSHNGKELVVEVPNRGTAHMRFVVAGRRLYKLTALGAHRPPEAAEVAKFFDSFQIME